MDLKSPVGFPCLFELMGVELPEPPSAPEAPTFFCEAQTLDPTRARDHQSVDPRSRFL